MQHQDLGKESESGSGDRGERQASVGWLLPQLLFFISGGAALIYETVWVRELGRYLGNTSMSVAFVTGLFVGGLGLGSFLAGRLAWVQRLGSVSQLWKAYATCEVVVGVSASVALLAQSSWLPALPARTVSYQFDASGLHVISPGSLFLQLVVLALLILPGTIFMGATLPLLFRITRRAACSPGSTFGLLYAVNTAGAMTGCLMVDFALVPSIGSRATQAVAIAFNLLVAAVSWFASRRAADSGQLISDDTLAPAVGGKPSGGRRFLLGCAMVAVSGFVAMGFQVIWARFLTTALGGTRGVFSVLLTVILGGMWIGSLVGGWAVTRWRRPWLLSAGGISMVVVSAMAGLVWYDRQLITTGAFAEAHQLLERIHVGWLADVAFILRAVVPVAGVASFWAGFTLPSALEAITRGQNDQSERASVAYMMNCLGAWLGATVTGFCLLPEFGMQVSILLLSCGVLVIALALAHGEWFRIGPTRRIGAFATVATLAMLAYWNSLVPQYLLLKMFDAPRRPEGYLAISEDVVETIAVDEHPVTKDRYLLTNGHPMSGTSVGSVRYMRMFSHVPLLQLENPRDVLVICFGVGNTLHAASLYPSLTRLEVVDTSRHVLRQAPFFSEWNHDVLKDPRVQVFINDGRHHLQMQPRASYDLITLEPPPLGHAGVASLYTREFYHLAYSRLRQGGFVTQWLPALQVPESVLRSAVRAFVDVFPNAVLLHGHADNFILMGRASHANRLDLPLVQANLDRLPQVRRDLEEVFISTPTEFLGSFVASSERLDIFSDGVEALVDDKPSMEYGYLSFLETRLPADLAGVSGIRDWCSGLDWEGHRSGRVPDLPAYLAIMEDYYRTMPPLSFLKSRQPHRLQLDLRDPTLARAIQRSGYLQGILRAQLSERPSR